MPTAQGLLLVQVSRRMTNLVFEHWLSLLTQARPYRKMVVRQREITLWCSNYDALESSDPAGRDRSLVDSPRIQQTHRLGFGMCGLGLGRCQQTRSIFRSDLSRPGGRV